MDLSSLTGLAVDMTSIDPEMFTAGGIMALIAAFGIILFLLFIPAYIYGALTLMFTAKRLGHKYPWLAWIPFANMWLLAELGKMPGYLGLIGLLGGVPIIGPLAGTASVVLAFIWMWRVCEQRNKPGWWPLLIFIPVVGWIWGLVMWGILAWGKK